MPWEGDTEKQYLDGVYVSEGPFEKGELQPLPKHKDAVSQIDSRGVGRGFVI